VLVTASAAALFSLASIAYAQSEEGPQLFMGPNCVGKLTSHYAGEKGGTEDINIGIGELQKARAGYVKFGSIKGETDTSGDQTRKKPKEIVVVGSIVAEQIIACVDSRSS